MIKRRYILTLMTIVASGCAPANVSWYSAVDGQLNRPKDADETWDFTNEPQPEMLSREAALEILLKTEIFASETVGAAASLSTQVRAFRRILAEPEAASAFRELLRRGRTAGQLYALCGLRLVDRSEFDRQFPRYRNNPSTVMTLSGCIGERETVASIVEKKDAVRLSPGQTIASLVKGQPNASWTIDIVGGGYSDGFAALSNWRGTVEDRTTEPIDK